MGACAASKLAAAGDAPAADPVALLRRRKRHLKSAVARRASLAAAHASYAHALNAVAAALDIFVSRHSAPTPLLTILPSDPKPPPLALPHSPRPSSPSNSTPGRDEGRDEGLEWDFFNDLEVAGIVEDGEEVLERELEGNDVKVAPLGAKGNEGEELAMVERSEGRELLQALRDVEDHFIRAFESGKEVSRMLEAERFDLRSALEDTQENSSKTIQSLTWHRSSSLSSSSTSQLASSCVSSSWTESYSDLFDECGGMASGSLSQTLESLYAWEKKLYEEVKAGDETRQIYEKKCMLLQNQEAKGADSRSLDKTRSAVRDLHSRIWVALRAAESISQRIQKLRDEELQPQMIELIQGLSRSWRVMLESHETQKQIMFEVNTLTSPAYGRHCNESQRLATTILATELRNWRTCFMSYVSAQREYVEALDGWLSMFLLSDVEYYSQTRCSLPYNKNGAPLLIFICHDWFASLSKLPDQPVSLSMKNFTRTVRSLWAKQGEEMQQKRKVDNLEKELDHRIIALQKAENKVAEAKLTEDNTDNTEMDVQQRAEYLSRKKELLDVFRKKLDIEKSKLHDCMQETNEITLNGFKIGLASIFDSLTDFSKVSVKLYGELLTNSENSLSVDVGNSKSCCVECSGSEMESDDG